MPVYETSTQKAVMDYIKHSLEENSDKINTIANGSK